MKKPANAKKVLFWYYQTGNETAIIKLELININKDDSKHLPTKIGLF
jgi:hypothetical protein